MLTESENIPRSNTLSPTYGIRGFGIMIVVCPAYAINNGRAAIDGRNNFLLIIISRKRVRIIKLSSESHAAENNY